MIGASVMKELQDIKRISSNNYPKSTQLKLKENNLAKQKKFSSNSNKDTQIRKIFCRSSCPEMFHEVGVFL